jgi:hypothetical protein
MDIQLTATATAAACNASGSLAVEVLAGNGDYSYQWSHGGADTAYVAGLPAGSYSVVVTDAHGCQDSASAVLELPTLSLSLSLENGLLAWTSVGGTSRVQYRPSTADAWTSLSVSQNVPTGEQRTYPVGACGYYRVFESSGLCGNFFSNAIARPAVTQTNVPEFASALTPFNQDGFSFYRLRVTAVPEGVADSASVLLQVSEQGQLIREELVPLWRLQGAGDIAALYLSCTNYDFVLSLVHDCTTYLITRTLKSSVVNINLSRFGRKVLLPLDTLDLRWSLNEAEIAAAGTSIAYYTLLVQETNRGGSALGPEVALQTISDPAQVAAREVRITAEELRAAGLLSAGQSIQDRNFRFRVRTNLTGCGQAFSNSYHQYRCASFSLMTGCATPESCASAARLSVLPDGQEQSRGNGDLWSVTAYPNPTQGGFHLLVPENLLEGGDLRLSVLNSAGQVLLETSLQESGPTPFDFSGQPAGLYLLRLHRGEEVRSIRLVLE